MWSAIAKIFKKGNNEQSGETKFVEEMDRPEVKRSDEMPDTYDTTQAKQRAAIKWLLSKAFNNKVPENLSEPFYRDYENQEHLKPHIVGALASAEMYCMALGNIYSDPNYHNLNHWSILQTLARKGVYVSEPNNSALTETTLIQTNPLRLNAHMAVIESIMTLYAKEVITSDRVLAAIQRFSHSGKYPQVKTPDTYEQGLLMWVSHTCDALQQKIQQDLNVGVTNGGEGDRLRPPEFPQLKDMKDLCDGVALAALLSYYCPDELPWTAIKVSRLPTISESLHNLSLVQDFCNRCLQSSVFHMLPEDITYMRGSMKTTLVAFLADLFNVLEIHPIKCVRYPGSEKMSMESFPPRNAHGVVHKRNLTQSVMSPIPDLRSNLDDPAVQAFQVSRSTPTHTPLKKTNSFQLSMSEMSEDSLRRPSSEDSSFVVHRGKNIPTLSSILGVKEKQNNDSKADERGESKAAGKPSNWEENKRPTFAGRRSRRNSTSDDSQLTIENFGGSQDNLNFIGRNPDKEVGAHVGRKISTPSIEKMERIENPAVRSSLQDARGSFQLGYDNGCEKSEYEKESFKLKKQLSSDDISLRNLTLKEKENQQLITETEVVDGDTTRMSFADLKLGGNSPKGIQLTYIHGEKDDEQQKKLLSKSSFLNKSNSTTNGGEQQKKTCFATLPNTTTWQQQSNNNMLQANQSHNNNNQSVENNVDDHSNMGPVMAAQLTDIKMKLEEKRRQIETEKRKMEIVMDKQRQKVGKAAFLQAVVKGKSNVVKPHNDIMADSLVAGSGGGGSEPASPAPEHTTTTVPKPQRPFTLQEINDDASATERKWLERNEPFVETRRTPDIENMDLEQYQQSMAQMNTSLQDIQADIQRLANQHQQIQAAQDHQKQPMYPQGFMTVTHHHHHPQYSSQQSYHQPQQYQPSIYAPLQTSASAPHIPQTLYQSNQSQFFLHQSNQQQQQAPMIPQRRTWAQQPLPVNLESFGGGGGQANEMRTWGKPQNPASFILHEQTERYQDKYQEKYQEKERYQEFGGLQRYQNGSGSDHNLNSHHQGFSLSQQHQQSQLYGTPSASPQHKNIHRQISQLMEPVRKSSITHAPIPAPPVDDMAPQNISFIGNPDEEISEGISRLNITSGSRTYRIPSPTRPLISKNSFQPSPSPPVVEKSTPSKTEVSSLNNDPINQKGFYISFDNEQPKRPKPPLRTKRMSPKKERSYIEDDQNYETPPPLEKSERTKQLERELEQERLKTKLEEEFRAKEHSARYRMEENIVRKTRETSQERAEKAEAIIIGNELSNPDPELMDEKERKKERIMLLSLQRRQQQEEVKQIKEQEAQARREKEKMKEEEKARKKEEQAQRRAAIFEQYKIKKAIEEAEREGKDVDKGLLHSLKPTPKVRAKGAVRPRPKTIHIDSGSVEMAEGMLQPSRAKRGSNTNLTDSPDDSRGMSPCHSANQTLGRRSSYKTSRDPSPAQVRGRPKYSTYQNFKGRKSNSMMNLYGSSTDQDSLAYRYGDTDSGLGRATPPRRAPSPGMGPMRHLPSPSGPGSLPGLMSKRRIFDDGSSDISSSSSMMDYTGPRLYKQPATKSNRGIMLNAVEYCVFPGVVNKEAKQKVLEEIARSESKHFLILFRDTGCQFRALYSYCPDREEVLKLYGTGPKQVNDRMFDKFFKYNSGGKCFSQVHTKHLTVTIDAFTIHNSLWQGKKVNLPNKKDMALVI
ncbi:patronin isoform X4 [Onthophagus taurus]|uniref:patronin isoform X4 n=1 Tax=Onthophagus taurus TaxID=166361 RepID=UPI0039BDEBBE